MFVDKVLVGLAARPDALAAQPDHPEKTDTFVLDFRNDADAITEAFRPGTRRRSPSRRSPTSSTTSPTASSPSRFSDHGEARAVAAVIADRNQEGWRHGFGLRSSRPRRRAVQGDVTRRAVEVRDALDQYVRAYSFLFSGRGLRRCRARGALPRQPRLIGYCRGRRRPLDLGSDVELTHLRLEKTSEGDITPDHGVGS